MPYSLVLHCVSANGPLRPEEFQGQKGLALFLEELIQKQDAAVAARLHAPRNAKPFTTAILTQPSRIGYRQPPATSDRAPQNPNESSEVKVRITLLDDTLYALVSQFFLQHLSGMPVLRLGQSDLIVSRVLATPESGEPWAGFARFEDILTASSPSEFSWSIHFATPTSFKVRDAVLPLPIPRLCFQSWLNSWDEHAPVAFFQDKAERRDFLSTVVEDNVSVTYSEVRLVKRTLFFGGVRTREQGFIGTCRFAVRPARVVPEHRKILDVLTRYSYFAGTGRKTTMGMGMTRRLEKE
jgi:CRISPR-associated endoribonuclease Cas6